MYLSHYNLREKPFKINPDPRFLWLGETHKEALATLKYGILENKGFLLLTGDVGTGKTTLINALIESLDEDTICAIITDPGLEKLDFYNFLAHAFKIDKKFESKGDFLVHFMHFLHKAYKENKKVLLIIDESQRIPPEMMEEMRLLSNIEKQDAKLLNIFLVGQDELNVHLADPGNRALMQRITTRYSIGPLKKHEIGEYIGFRLKVAGLEKNIFSSSAIREVISFSKCYPRLINIICDRALLTGFVQGKEILDAKIVKECARELQAPKATLKKKIMEGGKSAWKIPVFGLLCVLILVVAGYFYFATRPDKHSQQAGSVKLSQTVEMTRAEKNIPSKITAQDPENKGSKGETQEERPPAVTDVAETTSAPLPFDGQKLIIYFPLNSNEFSYEAYKQLDRFVEVVLQNPDAEVVVKGYTDSTGSASYNKRLSEFRANIVKSYFVGQGVAPSKIKAIGLGPENPIGSNATEQGRSANRRIEIELKAD